jgi:hypothetical protein
MRIVVEFATSHAIADGPLATRRILHVANGEFEGPALRGKVLPGGGDWVLVRRDGRRRRHSCSRRNRRCSRRYRSYSRIYRTWAWK